MTALNDRLDEWEALAEKATPGPWFLDAPGHGDERVFVGNRGDGREHGLWDIVHASSDALRDLTPAAAASETANAAFIAEARTAVPMLIGALRAVLAIKWETRVNSWSEDIDHGFAQGQAAACDAVAAVIASALGVDL